MNQIAFGKEMRKAFDLEQPYFNHGSRGLAPNYIIDKKCQYTKEVQKFPELFYSKHLSERILKSRRLLSDLVKCDLDSLVLVNSATSGVNAVLRSFPFAKNDVIVYFSTIFNPCYNTLLFVKHQVGVDLIQIDITYPISDDEILHKFELCVSENGLKSSKTKQVMVFMDGISSVPAVSFPWKKLVKLCAQQNFISFVDGAHYVGCKALDLTANKPDFFVSNLHKWFFVSNSVAMLYVDPKHHLKIHSMPVSSTYIDSQGLCHSGFKTGSAPKNALAAQFEYQSTLDYTSYATIPDAFEFREKVCGPEKKILEYNLDCAQKGAQLMLEAWEGSELMCPVTDCPTINYKIPGYSVKEGFSEDQLNAICKEVQSFLLFEKHTSLAVYVHGGAVYTRWLAMIHLEPQDFLEGLSWLKEAFNQCSVKP